VSAAFLNISAVPPLPVAETEPNDSRARPQVLATLPVVVSAATAVTNPAMRDDVDFFRVVLQPGRTLNASLTPNPAAGHSLALLNFAGDTLVSSALGLGQVNTVSWTNTTASVLPVTLRVLRNAGMSGPVTGSYSLWVADN
jgi:hypothetical protein